MSIDDRLVFAEEAPVQEEIPRGTPWYLLIADDDDEVHAVTKLALNGFRFEGKNVECLSAYSGIETLRVLQDHDDIALVLLDVVMETESTGLEVVQKIREEVRNPFVRIVLRTGQPGQAPEMQVIQDFDINDYKEKVELTDKKLLTTVIAGLRNYRDLRSIQDNLKEKEVLLKEIHHRVKNNLQIISSLLSMQTARIEDAEALEVFRDSRDRVRSMAMIHEQLYQSGDFRNVDLATYIQNLVSELKAIYGRDDRDLRCVFELESVSVSLETAIPTGLILNELITNSLKYAFEDTPNGELRIGFRLSDDKTQVVLTVQDNGPGLPAGTEIDGASTMGLQLVSVLSEQIGASVEVDTDHGTRFRLEFPPD